MMFYVVYGEIISAAWNKVIMYFKKYKKNVTYATVIIHEHIFMTQKQNTFYIVWKIRKSCLFTCKLTFFVYFCFRWVFVEYMRQIQNTNTEYEVIF